MRLLVWLFALALALAPAAAGPRDSCLICDGEPGTATRWVEVYGRTVPLCDQEYCEDEARRDPARNLAALAGRSALFRDEMDFQRRPSWAAFALGVSALAAVLAIAMLAHRRVGGGGLTRTPSTPVPVACGSCGAENHPSACACARCHGALQACETREVDRA